MLRTEDQCPVVIAATLDDIVELAWWLFGIYLYLGTMFIRFVVKWNS